MVISKGLILATPVARLTAFGNLDEDDYKVLAKMGGTGRKFAVNEFLQREGSDFRRIWLLMTGVTASSVNRANGRRRLLRIHLSGDLVGLPSLAMMTAASSIIALSPVVAIPIKISVLTEVFESYPRLAALIFLVSQEERVALMDRLISVGGLSIVERVANLLLHIHARLLCSDPDAGEAFHLPLTQGDVADLVGCTPVHANRAIQHLRSAGLVSWNRQDIELLNRPALVKLAGYIPRIVERDPSWLPVNP
jgi:CRP/FNR family transcriptional regulator